jgi:hypothetical protein
MSKFFEGLSKHRLKVVLGLAWFILFFSGLSHFTESRTVYVLFSIAFLAMLLSGIYRRVSYGYLFLVIFLWLGFWFKLTANFFLFEYFPFGEPVGSFNSSAQSWDTVLRVAICGSVGVMFGRFLYEIFSSRRPNPDQATAPLWYPAVRKWLWAAALITTLAVAVVNGYLGIHQVGLTPRTLLPWPLNAAIAWMLNLGSALLIAVLIWWDMAEGRNIKPQLYAMLGEAFLSTVSVISRASFPFHVIPQLVALGGRKEVRQRYSKKQVFQFFAVFVVLFLASIAAVSFMRDYQYTASTAVPTPEPKLVPHAAIGAAQPSRADAPVRPVEKISSFRLILIHQLLVNRWIGLEGVMAVSSSSEKSPLLLWELLTEKREAGKVSVYQRVSNSGYQIADPKYQFASLPGAVAFFFCSGSLTMVFLGMAATALLIMLSENAIFALTGNPLICSLFGMMAANTAAQFGVAPRQDIPYFLLIFLSAVFICFLQSAKFASALTRFHAKFRPLS